MMPPSGSPKATLASDAPQAHLPKPMPMQCYPRCKRQTMPAVNAKAPAEHHAMPRDSESSQSSTRTSEPLLRACAQGARVRWAAPTEVVLRAHLEESRSGGALAVGESRRLLLLPGVVVGLGLLGLSRLLGRTEAQCARILLAAAPEAVGTALEEARAWCADGGVG